MKKTPARTSQRRFQRLIAFVRSAVALVVLLAAAPVVTAEVTIDATIRTSGNSHVGTSPVTAFTSSLVGYAFFRDGNATIVYRKTVDGGATWGPNTFVGSIDMFQVAIWYDRWTPGNLTGQYIHVAMIDDVADDLWYARLDTTTDTLAGPVSLSAATGQGGTLNRGGNTCTITRGTDGDLYAGVHDGSDSFIVKCLGTADPTVGANWAETGAGMLDLQNDQLILVPLLSGDVMAIRWDISANDVQSRVYTKATDTWDGAWTNIDANATDSGTYIGAFGATVNRVTGSVYFTYCSDYPVGGTNDVRTAVYSGGAWTVKADILTNDARGVTGTKIALDENSGDIYCAYTARTTAGTANTGNVYWKQSTDGMTTWGAEQGPVNSAAGDLFSCPMNIVDGERIFLAWANGSTSVLYGATLATFTHARRYWIGAGAGSFSDNSRWSLTSGGANDATAPTYVHIATFDGGGVGDCSITASAAVYQFDVRADGGGSGYAGAISQSNGTTLTVGAGGFAMAAGTFTGGNATSSIDVNAGLALTGGAFTAPGGTLSVEGDFTLSAPATFAPNAGTLGFDGKAGQTFTTNGAAFNNVTVSNTSTTAWAVDIDGSADTVGAEHNGTSPTLVFTSATTGYAFYLDNSGACVYSKTIDGGATWAAAVTVDAQTDICGFAVWYDRWTPGDTTGPYVHICTADIGNDDLWYSRLDTDTDTLAGPVSTAAAQGSTLNAAANLPSITKGTDGDLYMGIQDTSDSFVVKCPNGSDPTNGANWSEAGPNPFTNAENWLILLPLPAGDVLAIRYNVSGGSVDSKVYDDATATWDGAWTAVDAAAPTHTTYDACYGAALNKATNEVYLAYAANNATPGTDDDIRCAVYTPSSGTWTARANVITSSDVGGGRNLGVTGVKTAVDDGSGDVFVLYSARTTPGTASTGQVYVRRSADAMRSWGGEEGPLNLVSGDMYGARMTLLSAGGTLYAGWSDTTPNTYAGRQVRRGLTGVVVSGALDVDGTLTINSSRLDLATNNPAVNTAGDVTVGNAGVVRAGTGVWTFDGSGTSTLISNAQSLGTVVVNGAAKTVQLGGACVIPSLSVGADDVFDLASYNAVLGVVSNNNLIQLRGGETVSLTTPDTDSGTVEYNGGGAYTGLAFGGSYYHLLFSGAGSWTQSAAATVNGSLTISGGTFASGGFGVTLLGNWANSAAYTAGANTVTFADASTVSGSSVTTFNNVTINGASTLTGHAGTMNVAGNFVNNGTYTHNSGTVVFSGTTTVSGSSTTSFDKVTINATSTLTGHSGTMNVGGNFANSGTYTHNSGTVAFNGTTTVSGPSTTSFNHVTINGSSTLTGHASLMNVAGNFVNNGTYTHNSGTVAFNGSTTVSGSATTSFRNVTISGASTLVGHSGTMNVAGVWTNGGTFTHNSGTVAFNGTTTFSGASVTSFSNVSISGGASVTAPGTMRVAGSFANDGTFTHNSGTVEFNGTTAVSGSATTSFNNVTVNGVSALTAPSGTMNVAGNFTNGGAFTPNSGTVVFNGSSTVGGASTTTFKHVTIDPSSTLTAPGGTMNVAGNFVNNGTFTHGSGLVVFNGTTAVSGSSTTSFSGVTINGSSALTAPSGTMNVAGNFTNGGTFTHNSGTVVFNGAALQTIGGGVGSTFNTLTVSNGSASGARLGVNTAASAVNVSAGATLDLAVYTLALGGGDMTIGATGILVVGDGGRLTGVGAGSSFGGRVTLSGNGVGDDSLAVVGLPAAQNQVTLASGTRIFGQAMTLAGALTVAGGATMRVTSAGTVTLDGGGSVSGLLDLEPAATLALADGTTLAVNGAGTLEVKGTGPLDRPVITGSTSTAAFTVTVNGALDADQFTVQRGRLVFGASATVTGLNRGRFLSHPGSGLAYVDFSSYNGVNLEFMTLEFGNANGRPNARNVKGPGGPHITCEAAFGVLSGERFDDDVANRVHWQTTPRTVMIGSTTYPSINAALAAAVANDTITIADNALHRGNFVLNKNGLTLQGGLIEGNVDTDGVATGVKLRNLFVVGAIGATNGPNLVEHCSVYNATAANGTITAAGAGNQARYSIATGAITATTSTQNVASAVAAANFINPGAGDLHLKPGSAAIGLAALSTVNSDIDGATRPDGAARDAGADEFASNNAGAILWDSANFGPVSQSFKEWWGDYAWVATGTLDADAAGAWQNALALVNVNTGAVLAGICSTGASPPANVGFPAGFTIPGPVSRVRGWYDAANNQHLLYFTIDSDSDGRDDTLRKIRTPGTPYAMPTWASATVEWSFTVSEGPLGAFEFTTASPWDMIVIADQDTGREPSGNPVLYKLSGATGAILATNNSYPWNYAGGINSLTSNGFFAAIKSGAAGGEDIARLDQDLAVLQAVDLGGAAGLEQAPTAVMFGGARVYAPTPNQQVHALLVSNLNADTAFSTDGVFDLVADGVVPGGDSPVNSTAVLCAFGVRWVFVGYAVGDVGYVAKIRDAPTPTIGDADFSLGARVPIRGQPLMPLSIDKRVGRLSVLTTDGRMVVLTFNNSLTDTPGDGALYSGFPRKVPGAGARSIMWTVTTTVGTVALVGVDGDRLLAMKHK